MVFCSTFVTCYLGVQSNFLCYHFSSKEKKGVLDKEKMVEEIRKVDGRPLRKKPAAITASMYVTDS